MMTPLVRPAIKLRYRPDGNGRANGPLRADLRASCLDGVAFGGMVGLGETYLAAFVLAVGLGELTAGLIGSLPLVVGGLMQTVSPWAVRRLGSHKQWVLVCAVVQALIFVPLTAAAWYGGITAPLVLALAAVYWGAGLATGPAWNTWIGTVVPRPIRPRFFALRTRGSQAAVFVGFLIGGVGLQLAQTRGLVLPAFAAIFSIAAVCRGFSVCFLWRQSEPRPVPINGHRMRWTRVLRQFHQHSGGRLLVYLVAVQACVQMAGPYFTPFMFEELRLSYADFVMLISAAFLAKVLVLPAWGQAAHRIGAWRLLWIGGLGIAPLSAAWLVSQSFGWLLVVQITGGIMWAAYELAFFLLFFESIDERDRVHFLTAYNFINTLAWAGGALVGGALLFAFDFHYQGYLLVFGVSSLGRCLALVLLARVARQEVDQPFAGREIGLRTMAVRPNVASLDAPVLPSLPDHADG